MLRAANAGIRRVVAVGGHTIRNECSYRRSPNTMTRSWSDIECSAHRAAGSARSDATRERPAMKKFILAVIGGATAVAIAARIWTRRPKAAESTELDMVGQEAPASRCP